MIRIVGLSATLPNYEDVSNFLHVSPSTGNDSHKTLLQIREKSRTASVVVVFISITSRAFSYMTNVLNLVCLCFPAPFLI